MNTYCAKCPKLYKSCRGIPIVETVERPRCYENLEPVTERIKRKWAW